MTATLDDEVAELRLANAELQRRLDESRAELQARTAERDEGEAQKAATAEALQESLQYQTATSDVLKVISRSTFDLQPVLDTLVKTAARLCNSDTAHLFTRNDEAYRAVASFAHSPEFDSFVRGRLFTPGRETVAGRTVLEGRVVHIADLAEDSEFALPEAVSIGRIRTVLGVPLLRERQSIGVITLSRQRVEPFTDRQIELVRTFADQAVIAIENTRLITETREALDQQTATAEVLQVINSSPGDLAPVFDAMLEKATRLCTAPYGQLAIYDGEVFRFVAAHGEAPFAAELSSEPHPPSHGVTWLRIIDGENVVHIPDVRNTDLYRSGHLQTQQFVENGGGRSLLSVGLRKDNLLLGVLSIYRQEPRPFSVKEIALLENFAAQAVIAIENARLISETREALEQQTATAEVLGVINSSPGDLAPVFQAILEKAHVLCDADHGTLTVSEREHFRAVAMQGIPEAFAAILRRPFTRRTGFWTDY